MRARDSRTSRMAFHKLVALNEIYHVWAENDVLDDRTPYPDPMARSAPLKSAVDAGDRPARDFVMTVNGHDDVDGGDEQWRQFLQKNWRSFYVPRYQQQRSWQDTGSF